MPFKFKNTRLLALTVGYALISSPALAAETASDLTVSKNTVFWATFSIMTTALALLFLFIGFGLLRSGTWQLGDALSEEAGNQPNPLPESVKPVMVASSSRLIALLGLLSILSVFVGFGYFFLYTAFAGTQSSFDMNKVISYLFSGAVLFAPYLVNQLREAFTAFANPQSGIQQVIPQPTAQMKQVVLQTRGAVG